MNDNTLTKYQYLWDGSRPGWVLLKAPDLPGGYCVFHKPNRTLLHIDDSNLNEAVCKEMKRYGSEILDKIPPGNINAATSPT
jgi:hypothetical protein